MPEFVYLVVLLIVALLDLTVFGSALIRNCNTSFRTSCSAPISSRFFKAVSTQPHTIVYHLSEHPHQRLSRVMLQRKCCNSKFSGEKNDRSAYYISGINLYKRWAELVQAKKIQADITVPEGAGRKIRYGIRQNAIDGRLEEFVEIIHPENGDSGAVALNPAAVDVLAAASRINGTLSSLQSSRSLSSSSAAIRCLTSGPYVAQLQLVRTLRPAPSAGFVGATNSIPPPYDPARDSFLVGPHRLSLREKTARLQLSDSDRAWDIYHNISPADVRGHYLLLPDLDGKNNREQRLLPSDCSDLAEMASAVRPPGQLVLCFNSVGGGASQNHIHAHAWVRPEVSDYAVLSAGRLGRTRALRIISSLSATAAGTAGYDGSESRSQYVSIEMLDYPCCVVKLTGKCGRVPLKEGRSKILGRAIATVLEAIDDASHNVCLLNCPSTITASSSDDNNTNDEITDVMAFIFVRLHEKSPKVLKGRLGASEMMGIFHTGSEEEILEAASDIIVDGSNKRKSNVMELALLDVSAPKIKTWDAIRRAFLVGTDIWKGFVTEVDE